MNFNTQNSPRKEKPKSSHRWTNSLSKSNNNLSVSKRNNTSQTDLWSKKTSKSLTTKQYVLNYIAEYIQKHKILKHLPGDPRNNYEMTMKNLKEFLTYLESKQILTNAMIETKSTLKALINEIMQLDLVKFSKSSCIQTLKD